MQLNKQQINKIAVMTGLALGGYFLYRLSKGDKVSKAVERSIEQPLKVVEDVTKKTKSYLVKGSKEAKEHMAKLRAKRTGKKKTSKKKKVPATDGEIIKKHKLKGKKAEAVKSGDVKKLKKTGQLKK